MMNTELTRRDFGKMALGSIPFATAALNGANLFGQGRPNSKFDGVQIGVISYSFADMPAKDMITAMSNIGISAVELMSNHAEELAGAPSPNFLMKALNPVAQNSESQKLGPDGLLPRCESMKLVTVAEGEVPPTTAGSGSFLDFSWMTPDQKEEMTEQRKKLYEWRAAATPATWKAVRKQFDDAGIDLRILCYNLAFPPVTDDEIDYSFRMARDLGVEAISSSSTVDLIARVAYYADKYKIRWGGHGHDDVTDPLQFATPATFKYIMSFSPYIGVNLDIGHFSAGGFDAVSFIHEYHDRITNIHLKDRKRNSDFHALVTSVPVDNYPWGQGDTPIKEVLQLMKREHYKFPADIEYEYECRSQGTRLEEIAKCLSYAKRAIEG